MNNVVYVLFSIYRRKFDPALIGIFEDKEVAKEAERNLVLKHPNHTTSFILELPLCFSAKEYKNHFISTVSSQITEHIKVPRKDKIQIGNYDLNKLKTGKRY